MSDEEMKLQEDFDVMMSEKSTRNMLSMKESIDKRGDYSTSGIMRIFPGMAGIVVVRR